MHCIEQFKHGAVANLGIDPKHADAVRLAQWMLLEGLPLYESAFHQETRKAIPRLTDDKLVEQAYADGINDADRKLGQFAYYGANARVFMDICRGVANTIVNIQANTPELIAVADYFAPNHVKLLHTLGFDGVFLLEEWAENVQQTHAVYGVGKSMRHSAFQISHAADKVAHGWSPFFAYRDTAVESSPALIRVAIETRLRFGFGVLGIKECATGAILPLNLSALFKAIDAHASSVRFAVPLQNIKRLYGWSNIYVHLGVKDYMWSPMFALKYINSFLRGGSHATGFSVDAGIQTDKKTIEAIQDKVSTEGRLDSKKQELLLVCAENCDLVLCSV